MGVPKRGSAEVEFYGKCAERVWNRGREPVGVHSTTPMGSGPRFHVVSNVTARKLLQRFTAKSADFGIDPTE
jgi:hypothetical protein